jgi:hypothetical protein
MCHTCRHKECVGTAQHTRQLHNTIAVLHVVWCLVRFLLQARATTFNGC